MSSSKGKESLFAKRMRERREVELPISNDQRRENVFGDRSFIISGSEAEEIHRQNVALLSNASEEEIREVREKLLSVISPTLLEFVKSKRKSNVDVSMPEAAPPPERLEETTTQRDIIEIKEVKELMNQFPHMDVVEDDKLQWMGELQDPGPPPIDKPYNARFDFEGKLLPYSDDGRGVLKGLHNHGDEQERPGYTLQELIQLSRSSVLQQRVIALNTLSHIFSKAFMYEKCFESPMLPAVLDGETYLLLRFSLDDPAPPVVMASCGALCNILVNHSDESCLDLMLGTPLGLQQPSLGVPLELKPAEIAELKDPELLRLDLIKGALRTDLLARLRYILENLHPGPVDIKNILKILARISRHSYEATESVFSCPNLLGLTRSLLSFQGTSYYPEALKLFRVIICRSYSLASAILERFDILSPIFSVISGEKGEGHPELMQLTLEGFYTWQSLLNYNLATESIGSFTPVLMRLLDTHFGLTNLSSAGCDLEHATAILSLLLGVAKVDVNLIQHVLPLAYNLAIKWISQLPSYDNVSHHIAKAVGVALQLMALCQNENNDNGRLVGAIGKVFSSPIFKSSSAKLSKFSWLLNGELGTSPECLPCLGSVPLTLHADSVLPLFQGLSSFILATKNGELAKSLLTESSVVTYLNKILENKNINLLCGHWFARQEIAFIVSLIHSSVHVKGLNLLDLFQKLSFLCITLIQAGDKYLLVDIMSTVIFSLDYFRLCEGPVIDRLNALSLSSSNKLLEMRVRLFNEALSDFDKIRKCYMRELGLVGLTRFPLPATLTGLLNSTMAALPADWSFLPIVRIHNTEGSEQESIEAATRCLQWVLLMEETELYSGVSPTAKFCRLSCTFMVGNDLFREVTPLLETILHLVLRDASHIDLEAPIPGLTSFYDFYRDLLEQFTGVSYCDTVFGQFILVPLQRRHSSKYKKLVWSEETPALRLLSTPIEKVNMEEHLSPCETDPDVLMMYLYSLATGRVKDVWSPVLYRVALHHVSEYIQTNNDPVAKILKGRINKLGDSRLRQQLLGQ